MQAKNLSALHAGHNGCVPMPPEKRFSISLPGEMMKPFAYMVALCLFRLIPLEAAAVDATTLNGKVMCGYQGWFTAAGDDNPFDYWIHWTKNYQIPNGSNLCVEMYPDLSEFGVDELFPTAMTMGGAPAYLYSGRTAKTVDRHVRWMKEYGIDGIFAQRFVVVLSDPWPGYTAHFNAVRDNLLKSCADHGRVFAVMYDVSGASEDTFFQTIQSDWTNMVDQGIVDAPCYLKHKGKPVVGIWGFGFKDGVHPPTNPAVAQTLINWFKSDAPEKYRATVFGGVPGGWRDLDADSRSEAAWTNVYRSFDVISPWTVGRYGNESGADNWKASKIVPDLAQTGIFGVDYCPVIWPGFSWYNLVGGSKNQIPRNGGNFYWRQAYNAVTAGVDMIYVAMFDEVDEATAIYKTAPAAVNTPDQGYWLTLDADGYSLPSDWYLRLTFEVGEMLRHNAPVTSTMPANPGPLSTVPPTITTNPANATATAGGTAMFSVTATGTAPLSYQWYKNSSAIGGATALSYTTPATTTNDNGAAFKVTVTNAYGAATSSVATLTVNAAPTGGVVAAGGTVTNYSLGGTNWTAHIFTNTVTTSFNVTVGGTVEYLVVGGGGGGGGNRGGGGGAGGFIYTNAFPVIAGSNYAVIVGNGGTGGSTKLSGSDLESRKLL